MREQIFIKKGRPTAVRLLRKNGRYNFLAWSSSENSNNNAWNLCTGNGASQGGLDWNNKNNNPYVRPVLAFLIKIRLWWCKMQLDLFGDLSRGNVGLDELFEAYVECRRNKRRTSNALAFEVDFEQKLIALWKEVNDGSYMPGRSIAFIVTEPVQREVFAADFRDRIIHHLIIGKLNHLFEQSFIQDSYSCREGKGVQYGVARVASFIQECSQNYTRDCYILKMDIQSFFMSIDKKLLYKYLKEFILAKYHEQDKLLILELVEKVIFNNPEQNCHIKGKRSDWNGLPPTKSLFTSGRGKGLPIGNLTSQIFANFYLNFFDYYVKYDLNVEYYGRYVDDFVIVHQSKAFLMDIQHKLQSFLQTKLMLKLHPKKIYLQHFSKGVKFIGAVIKPGRAYIGNRTKGNLYAKIHYYNDLAGKNFAKAKKLLPEMLSSINSYLGFMIHYKTFNIRRRLLEKELSPLWRRFVQVDENMRKLILKDKYKPMVVQQRKIRNRRRNLKKNKISNHADAA